MSSRQPNPELVTRAERAQRAAAWTAGARNELSVYAKGVWRPFKLAPHHRLLVEELERVERGEIDRLMVFMPARHGKSLITSTIFPSWYLGRHPDRSVIATSYGAELALDFGRRVRGFVTDPLHTAIFPNCEVRFDANAAHRFSLAPGGNYYAVGAGGTLTGRGADLLIIDDPLKGFEDANSENARASLRAWYENVAYTRLAAGGAIVIIQTRWHAADLSGWLLAEHARDGWRTVSLAAIAEENDPLGRREGEALWPSEFPLKDLERIKEAIGSRAWVSLYQQRPRAAEGGIFKRQWWAYYDSPPENPRRIILSLDTAFKTGETSDYSVIEVWAETTTGYYLLHVWRQRADFPTLCRATQELASQWRANAVLIEDAASGQSLVQALTATSALPVIPVRPYGNKEARASAISPYVESGKVFLPRWAGWLGNFLDEVSSFPSAPHDDLVDSLSQFLGWVRISPARDPEHDRRQAEMLRHVSATWFQR